MGSGTEWIGFPCLSFLSFFSAWSFASTPFPLPCPANSTETGTSIASVNIRTPSRFTSLMFALRFDNVQTRTLPCQFLTGSVWCKVRDQEPRRI